MRPDPGRDLPEQIIGSMTVRERTIQVALLRERDVWQARHQADAAGITHPVQQADFLLHRLYLEMPEAWISDVLAKLAAKHAAGEWSGFERPADARMETK